MDVSGTTSGILTAFGQTLFKGFAILSYTDPFGHFRNGKQRFYDWGTPVNLQSTAVST